MMSSSSMLKIDPRKSKEIENGRLMDACIASVVEGTYGRTCVASAECQDVT